MELDFLQQQIDALEMRIDKLEACLAAALERNEQILNTIVEAMKLYAPRGDADRAVAALADVPGDDKAHEADPTQGPDE